jgi:LacI family transcriptional regulator
LAAVDALGYVPNVWAQRLARGHSGLIGLLMYDTTPAYTYTILDGLLDAGETAGYNISIHRRDTQDARQVAEILGMAAQHEIDGLVITPPCDNSPALLASLAEMQFPFVLIAPQGDCPHCASVAPADERGSYEAAWHLIRLGHTRIGYIQGPPDHQASGERLRGYERALREAGLPHQDDLIRAGDWEFDIGLEHGRALLSLPDRPTAIMAPNDVGASGVLQAAWERGLNCPRQISVVGFDDIPLARQVCPPLTTVRQPIYEIATTAMNLLIEQMTSGNATPGQVEMPTELVIRHSTGPAPSQ